MLSCLRLVLTGAHLQITGSDLDLTITVDLEVAGEDDGESVIASKLLVDIVRSLEPGAVVIETDADEARIQCGRYQSSLLVRRSEDFPQLSQPTAEAVKLDVAMFAEGLGQVVPAASGDESRPVLTGVLLAAEGTGLRMVSTDSYRLAVRDLPGTSLLDEGQTVLVPSRALNELKRVLDHADSMTLVLGEREASFVVGGTRLTTRLIEGDFPNYRQLIPQSQPNRLTVGRQQLIDAVRRVKLMAREATPVRLNMRDGSVELIAVTQELGKAHEEIDAHYTGEELMVAFNPEYLLDGLDVAPGDEVTLETVDPQRPALLRSTTSTDFLYLLMPVRVS